MKTNVFKIAALSISIGITVISCNKTDSISASNQATSVVTDNQTANEQSETAYQMVDDATFLPFGGRNFRGTEEALGKDDGGFFPNLGMGWGKPWKGKDGNCATITKTMTNNVITIVYDLSAVAGGVCGTSQVGGKMTISFPVRPDSTFSGTLVRTVTYDNFKRDSITINGTHKITTTLVGGKATASEKLATVTIANSSSGKTITYTSTRTRTIDNKGTADRSDDESSVNGTTTGTSTDGTSFSTIITKALLNKSSCSESRGFPVSGTEEITKADGTKIVVDYGDGTCDLKYTETTNGVTVEKERTHGKGKKGDKGGNK